MSESKIAIVTGGAKRVGRAISLALASAGYDVAVIYNSSAADAQTLKAEVEAMGRNITLHKADLNEYSSTISVISQILEQNNNVKLLVNNASIFEKHSFAQTDEDIFDRHMNINFKAPFFLTQKYSEYCRKHGFAGHVVNVLDSYVFQHKTPYFIYLLSKKALLDLTKMVALEAESSLRVNSVSIGLLLPSEDWSEERIAQRAQQLPIKRAAKLSEITDAILFLDKNQYITGENIAVDGGLN
jgi:NAD(P)-dependent dehydrogenase (short-subunit alcohol dehydrogenase family)